MFEPFWRHAASASRNGLGLGLHICSQIVRAESQLGSGIEGDRSRSLTTLGANSHHSTPTPSTVFRDTYAVIAVARCDGIWNLTLIRVCNPQSTSAFTSAPLKLRFFMRPTPSAKAFVDTWTGILT